MSFCASVSFSDPHLSFQAILNDTTGTLVRGAYDDPATRIGLILGTGCNGSYIERKENVVRWGKAKPGWWQFNFFGPITAPIYARKSGQSAICSNGYMLL